jgi:hypothetical protein
MATGSPFARATTPLTSCAMGPDATPPAWLLSDPVLGVKTDTRDGRDHSQNGRRALQVLGKTRARVGWMTIEVEKRSR